MARPDVRFNTPTPPPTPAVDLSFTNPPKVIDLRDRLVLTDAEARAMLGVASDADWETVRLAYIFQLERLDAERHRINHAYATLRLLAAE